MNEDTNQAQQHSPHPPNLQASSFSDPNHQPPLGSSIEHEVESPDLVRKSGVGFEKGDEWAEAADGASF